MVLVERVVSLKLSTLGVLLLKNTNKHIHTNIYSTVAETCFETMLRVFRLRGLGVKVKMLSYTLRGLTVTKVRAVECYD